jgi:SAM-dependent methyltransferase
VTRYDRIGTDYASTRREDPGLRARIHAALGGARSVVNVGAGTGSYEPTGCHVVAVEPSDVMSAQRPPDRAPAIRGRAEELPLADDAVDAAMAVLSLHHWDDPGQGIREMRRVARGPVVVVTFDPVVSGEMWLVKDHLIEVAELDRRIFPPPSSVAGWLGGARIETWEIPRDTPDWTLGSFWAHPERVLDPLARGATSGFARMDPAVVERVVREVERDLATGAWDERQGHLRRLERFDAGMRIVIADGGARSGR